MICARRTSPAPSFCERVIRASLCPSSSRNARTRRVIATSPARTGTPCNAPDSEKSHPTYRIHHLVVHPLSCCGIWHNGDPGAARGAVPPSAAPDEGMLVRVPVRGGAPDGFFDLGPGFEAAPFEGQRAQDLPPRLN